MLEGLGRSPRGAAPGMELPKPHPGWESQPRVPARLQREQEDSKAGLSTAQQAQALTGTAVAQRPLPPGTGEDARLSLGSSTMEQIPPGTQKAAHP